MSRPITTLSSPTLQIPSFSRLSPQTPKIQTISCHSVAIKTRPLCSHNQTLKRFGLFLDSRDRKLGFPVNAENGEGQSKRDDVFDDGERGESTMPERFRYLTKEAPDPPVKWPWFVGFTFCLEISCSWCDKYYYYYH
ncbi:hypothetical protein OIU74_027276 [Salix koriyanagi]|uniref:Uncharacterized protein n=1 Tax=Salix koriyanagi TaxID=2511006 RepID=A0A9Q0W179_9ROSI|nr:hypothetical protein OIU74_027276 [Salix koriyanagi]